MGYWVHQAELISTFCFSSIYGTLTVILNSPEISDTDQNICGIICFSIYGCMYVCVYILSIWNKDVWKYRGQMFFLWEFMFSYKLGCKMGIITTVWLTATLKLLSLERKKQKRNLDLLTLEGNEGLSQKGWARCAAVKGTGK